jgi:hypothetical protein
VSDRDLRQLQRDAAVGVPGAQERYDNAVTRIVGHPLNITGGRVCDRCKWPTVGFIMSMFNTEDICSKCKAQERLRPDYKQAEAKDTDQWADLMEEAGAHPHAVANVREHARKLREGEL